MNLLDESISKRETLLGADWLYVVAGGVDYRTQLDNVKAFLGIEDSEPWKSETLPANKTSFINLADATIIGMVRLEYLMRRGTRNVRSGTLSLLCYDGANIEIADYQEATPPNYEMQGVTLGGSVSVGTIQLSLLVDNSDANDVTFNYKVITKRPLAV